jgi:hypothetical protein
LFALQKPNPIGEMVGNSTGKQLTDTLLKDNEKLRNYYIMSLFEIVLENKIFVVKILLKS